MLNFIKSRLVKLETANGAGLPPVIGIDGSIGSPRLWNKGTTREEAEVINASAEELIRLLGGPVPVGRDIKDSTGESEASR